MLTLVQMVSVMGNSGVLPSYFVWNMMPEYVGSMMSTSLTRIARNSFEAENIHMAGNVCDPQKWPPSRTSAMLDSWVGVVPKPTNAMSKLSELIVTPAYVNVSATYRLRKMLLYPPYTAIPAARHVSVAERFSKTLSW